MYKYLYLKVTRLEDEKSILLLANNIKSIDEYRGGWIVNFRDDIPPIKLLYDSSIEFILYKKESHHLVKCL